MATDGSPFEAAIWTAPLRETQNRISGILITVADVSDRTRLEEQLRLSQKMEAVGRLAGGIAHDFNNLLTVINGYSSMLVDTLKGNPYAVSQASEILGAGTRAGELVSQLLAFSRRQMIKPKPIEINQLIHDVERMLRRIIGEHIEFRTDLNPDAGWIHADPNQIEAVLLNLATNAQDAMAKGGVLESRLPPYASQQATTKHASSCLPDRMSVSPCATPATVWTPKPSSTSLSRSIRRSRWARAPVWGSRRCMEPSSRAAAGSSCPAAWARAQRSRFTCRG